MVEEEAAEALVGVAAAVGVLALPLALPVVSCLPACSSLRKMPFHHISLCSKLGASRLISMEPLRNVKHLSSATRCTRASWVNTALSFPQRMSTNWCRGSFCAGSSVSV